MTEDVSDKKQIGLTPAGSEALGILMGHGLFATESDAYRFGIAYSIANALDVSRAPAGKYETKFNAAGGLDRDGTVRDLLLILGVGDRSRPYATAERLAEIGVAALAKRVAANEGLDKILDEMAAME